MNVLLYPFTVSFHVFRLLLIPIILVVSMQPPAHAATFSRDATFHVFRFSSPPQRIVSLSPYITELLFTLGQESRVVGVTTYCTHPSAAQKKSCVGTLQEPNIEAIVRLIPDCVFASKEDQQQKTIIALRKLNIPVFVFGEVHSFEDIEHHCIILGSIMNAPVPAQHIIATAEKTLETITAQLQQQRKQHKSKRKTVLCVLGIAPRVTVASGSFLDEAITRAGGDNIAHHSNARYPVFSDEAIIRKNPDVIFVITMEQDSHALQTINHLFPTVNAVQTNNVFLIDADDVCRATPPVFAHTVALLYSLLYSQQGEEL